MSYLYNPHTGEKALESYFWRRGTEMDGGEYFSMERLPARIVKITSHWSWVVPWEDLRSDDEVIADAIQEKADEFHAKHPEYLDAGFIPLGRPFLA